MSYERTHWSGSPYDPALVIGPFIEDIEIQYLRGVQFCRDHERYPGEVIVVHLDLGSDIALTTLERILRDRIGLLPQWTDEDVRSYLDLAAETKSECSIDTYPAMTSWTLRSRADVLCGVGEFASLNRPPSGAFWCVYYGRHPNSPNESSFVTSVEVPA